MVDANFIFFNNGGDLILFVEKNIIHGQVAVNGWLLSQVSDFNSVANADLTGVRAKFARQDLKQGCFAGTILPNEG